MKLRELKRVLAELEWKCSDIEKSPNPTELLEQYLLDTYFYNFYTSYFTGVANSVAPVSMIELQDCVARSVYLHEELVKVTQWMKSVIEHAKYLSTNPAKVVSKDITILHNLIKQEEIPYDWSSINGICINVQNYESLGMDIVTKLATYVLVISKPFTNIHYCIQDNSEGFVNGLYNYSNFDEYPFYEGTNLALRIEFAKLILDLVED